MDNRNNKEENLDNSRITPEMLKSRTGKGLSMADRKRPLFIKQNKHLFISEKIGPLTIYKMLLSLKTVDSQKIWEYGAEKPHKDNKVIMFVGEKGSDKSSLINTVLNCVFGVKWEDEFRVQLIDDRGGLSSFQTPRVTIYQINREDGFLIPYSITIIDIPEFGDTNEKRHNEKMMRQIREFFSKGSFTKIDAICFAVRSRLECLTATQMYIYENMLTIFGEIVRENIVFFAASAEAKEKNVPSTATEPTALPAQPDHGQFVYYIVDNAVVYADNSPTEDSNFTYVANELQWRMGMDSIKQFLSEYLPTLTSKCLSLKKEDLAETNALEVMLDGSVQKLMETMFVWCEVEERWRALKESKQHSETEFKIKVKQTIKKKIMSSENSTNCNTCQATCHQDCLVAFDAMKYFCEVFYWNAVCKVCGHGQSSHRSENFYWETTMVTKEIDYSEIKEKYKREYNEEMTYERILGKMQTEMSQGEKEAVAITQKIANSLRRLQEISSRSNPITVKDYIHVLIETERREKRSGYEERINVLEAAIRECIAK
ncbi:leucine-rich repeat-containing protein 61 isoform X2 [Hyperolius riggenbachi]|uniref:leucine-rich repeat-containing protein 61 isoform X2 n=1 Tax=Hyperolius riggenbachi TaxID=752182 RepID=UPI0035A2826B